MKNLVLILVYALIFAVGGASLEAFIGIDHPKVYAFFGFLVGAAMATTLAAMDDSP